MRKVFLVIAVVLAAQADAAPRDKGQVAAFRAQNPCPATGLVRGACPGWQVDHVVALCAGGADRPDNMQWLAVEPHKVKTRHDVTFCRARDTWRMP